MSRPQEPSDAFSAYEMTLTGNQLRHIVDYRVTSRNPFDKTHSKIKGGMHSHTWITQREIKSIDWNESMGDLLVTCSSKAPSGVECSTSHVHALSPRHPNAPAQPQEGDKWMEGNSVCRAEHFTRLRAVNNSFDLVFSMMDMLALRFGEDNVRLVVWFYD